MINIFLRRDYLDGIGVPWLVTYLWTRAAKSRLTI